MAITRFITCLLIILPAWLQAQSSVWKVFRGPAVVYLGGTCHLLRASDFPLPAEFDEAFRASRELIFETNIARMQSPEMQQVVLTEGLFLDGSTLENVVTPQTWRSVRQYCESSGLPLAQASQMKPWLFATTQIEGAASELIQATCINAVCGGGATTW